MDAGRLMRTETPTFVLNDLSAGLTCEHAIIVARTTLDGLEVMEFEFETVIDRC